MICLSLIDFLFKSIVQFYGILNLFVSAIQLPLILFYFVSVKLVNKCNSYMLLILLQINALKDSHSHC